MNDIRDDTLALKALMARRNPKLSSFWQAASCIGIFDAILGFLRGGMRPTNIAVASWTDTVQSYWCNVACPSEIFLCRRSTDLWISRNSKGQNNTGRGKCCGNRGLEFCCGAFP